MSASTPLPDPSELAELYAAGALAPDEATAFQARLDAGDPAALAAWSEVSAVADALSDALPTIAPPTAIRDKLLAQVEAAAQAEGPVVKRSADQPWGATEAPDIFVKVLDAFEDGQPRTMLVRLEAGACIPEHPHPYAEECLILEGDLQSEGYSLGKGDYMRFPANTTHRDAISKGGCLMFVTFATAA